MPTTPRDSAADDLDALLEAARRANWDALHGPRHLRSGRFRPELEEREVDRTLAPPPAKPETDVRG